MTKTRLTLISILAGTALAGCTTVREAVTEAVAGTHDASLTGAQVVGMSADADGSATAQLTVSDALDQICYDVNDLRNVGNVTRAGLYRGPMGANGTPVMWLKQDETGDWKNCVNKSDWLEKSLDRSYTNYYIQIETDTGAIRGQFH
jgi:hypothetical protein